MPKKVSAPDSGEPSASATGRDAGGWAVYGRAGLAPTLAIVEPLRLGVLVGLGAPFKTFAAAEDARVVTGVRGVELFAAFGILVEL